MIDTEDLKEWMSKEFDRNILPALYEYIRIPNVSRNYDPEWNTNGLLMKAANFIKGWVLTQKVAGLNCEIIKDEDKSPLIVCEVPGPEPPILFYGHYDKQPPMVGWHDWCGPYQPVIRDGKLYGRGGADDGYSTFAAVSIVKYLQEKKIALPRILIITEGDEESSSLHLKPYLDKLKDRLGTPDICFCLDSGADDYQHMYTDSTLRGCVIGDLEIKVMKEGLHSGTCSGIVPNPFRIFRTLLSRIEDEKSGDIIEEFQEHIEPSKYAQIYEKAQLMSKELIQFVPLLEGVKHMGKTELDALINRSFRPQLSVVGVSGFPQCKVAGNVTVPEATFRISMRISPFTKDAQRIQKRMKQILEENPPYNAKVTYKPLGAMIGYNGKPYSENLRKSIEEASMTFYGKKNMPSHTGGTIPLMGMLKQIFPNSQLVITGLLGPQSNAHGPNEFLHIDFTKKLLCCVAKIVADSASRQLKK